MLLFVELLELVDAFVGTLGLALARNQGQLLPGNSGRFLRRQSPFRRHAHTEVTPFLSKGGSKGLLRRFVDSGNIGVLPVFEQSSFFDGHGAGVDVDSVVRDAPTRTLFVFDQRLDPLSFMRRLHRAQDLLDAGCYTSKKTNFKSNYTSPEILIYRSNMNRKPVATGKKTCSFFLGSGLRD